MGNILFFVENEKSRVINTLLRHTYDVLLKQDWFRPPALIKSSIKWFYMTRKIKMRGGCFWRQQQLYAFPEAVRTTWVLVIKQEHG